GGAGPVRAVPPFRFAQVVGGGSHRTGPKSNSSGWLAPRRQRCDGGVNRSSNAEPRGEAARVDCIAIPVSRPPDSPAPTQPSERQVQRYHRQRVEPAVLQQLLTIGRLIIRIATANRHQGEQSRRVFSVPNAHFRVTEFGRDDRQDVLDAGSPAE